MSRIIPIWEYFIYNGKSSLDFNVKVSEGDFGAAERDIQSVEIPGRNGALTLDNGRFKNRRMLIPGYITKDFGPSLSAFLNHMLQDSGYHRYEDTYHPDVFVMARYTGPFEPSSVYAAESGKFTLEFDRMPQKWLKSGEIPIPVDDSAAVTVNNPTAFTALPLIKVTAGTGTITVNSTVVTLSANNGATIIDCEAQECYEGSTNRNSDLALTTGEFPKLVPGTNTITVGEDMEIELTPRWWRI